VCIYPNKLKESIERAGFPSADAIFRAWKDRGWLDVGTDRERYTKKVSLQGQKVWMVCVRREAFDV
jgi:hypothetical protein